MILHYEKVSSSNVFSGTYCEEIRVLLIRFHNGGLYAYHNVPLEVFLAFKEAKSKGSFIQKQLKGKYTGEAAQLICYADGGTLGVMEKIYFDRARRSA